MKRFLQRIFARNYEKKIILRTSDAWFMSHWSQRPCEPAYYIEVGFLRQAETIMTVMWAFGKSDQRPPGCSKPGEFSLNHNHTY